MQQLWTTDTVHPRESLSYWIEAVCRTYAPLDCAAGNPEALFYGHIDLSDVGDVRLTQVRSSAQKVRRSRSSIGRETEDKLLFSIQKSGHCNVVQDGRVATLMPGDLALYDTTRPYDLIFDGDFSQYVVALPGKVLRPHLAAPERLTARRISGGSGIGRAVFQAIESVMVDSDGLPKIAARPMEEALRGLLAAGILSLPDAEALPGQTAADARRALIKAYALQNLRDPELGVSSIAAAQGVDASTIHRAFDGEIETLSRWIWGKRLEHAYQDMRDATQSRRTLTDIAFSWGFNDMAHFSRAFKARFGHSPREARRSRPQTH